MAKRIDVSVKPTEQEILAHYQEQYERYKQNALNGYAFSIGTDKQTSFRLWNEAAEKIKGRRYG